MSEQQNPTLDDLLAKAHSIGENAASQADQAEKNCKLSDEIVDDINKARLIQVLQPKRFGGLEMGFPAMVRISQALAQHDMAASWIYSLFAIHHWWGSLVKPEMQDKLWKMYRYAEDMMEVGTAISNGEEVDTLEVRTRTFAWRSYPARSHGQCAGTPIQRFWRDFYAIAQHVVFNYEVGTRNYGRFLLGLEPLPAIY